MDLDEGDTLVAHTNGDAIREANGTDTNKVTISKEKLKEMTSDNVEDEEEKPKTTRRNKKDKEVTEEIEEIEETSPEEVEVEDDSILNCNLLHILVLKRGLNGSLFF